MRCTLGELRLPGRPCPQLGLEYMRRAGPTASNNGRFFFQKEAAVSPEREPKVLMGGSGTGGAARGAPQTLIVFSNYKILEKKLNKKSVRI